MRDCYSCSDANFALVVMLHLRVLRKGTQENHCKISRPRVALSKAPEELGSGAVRLQAQPCPRPSFGWAAYDRQ